jgi:hypothetical protein
MSKIISLEEYKCERNGSSITGPPGSPPFEKFLKGPVSLPWITSASKISSSALSVGVLLWYWYGLSGAPIIKLTTKKLKEFWISKRTAYRALQRMENAGLVLVDRKYGRAPLVRILMNV